MRFDTYRTHLLAHRNQKSGPASHPRGAGKGAPVTESASAAVAPPVPGVYNMVAALKLKERMSEAPMRYRRDGGQSRQMGEPRQGEGASQVVRGGGSSSAQVADAI